MCWGLAQKVSQVELQVKDFGQILDTLVLDAEVVRIRGPSGDKFRVRLLCIDYYWY